MQLFFTCEILILSSSYVIAINGGELITSEVLEIVVNLLVFITHCVLVELNYVPC
jgi:hypothetical protein